MKSHGRLPWPRPEDLDDPARSLYDRIAGGPRAAGPQAFALTDSAGRLNGPFNAMLVSPDVGAALQELGSAIRYKTQFPARMREIAILELARLRKSEFEWYAHARVGTQAGLTDGELAALHDGVPAPTFSEPETMARNLVRALVVERNLDDETFGRALDVLGRRDLVDMIVLVGYYESLALMLAALTTPLPDGIAPEFS